MVFYYETNAHESSYGVRFLPGQAMPRSDFKTTDKATDEVHTYANHALADSDTLHLLITVHVCELVLISNT